MRVIWERTKRIATDVIGAILILAAIFLGWLPGVGGIPLFLAGLGLLAINNAWAKRWLLYIKHHGSRITDAIFVNNPTVMLLNDILSATITAFSITILIFYDGYIVRTVAFFFLTIGVGIFLGNRKRLQRLTRRK